MLCRHCAHIWIVDNIIRENQWGGVDIRHGGDPVIAQNIICNGMSDGIVIGDKGRGSIENNIITGLSQVNLSETNSSHLFNRICMRT